MWFDIALKEEVTAELLPRCSAPFPPVGVSSGPRSEAEERSCGGRGAAGRQEGGRERGRKGGEVVEQREAWWLHPLMRRGVGWRRGGLTANQKHVRHLHLFSLSLFLPPFKTHTHTHACWADVQLFSSQVHMSFTLGSSPNFPSSLLISPSSLHHFAPPRHTPQVMSSSSSTPTHLHFTYTSSSFI